MTEKKRSRSYSPGHSGRPRIPVSSGTAERRPPAARGESFCVLHKSAAELERRFGAPLSVDDRTLVFADSENHVRANRIHVFLSEEGAAKLARIELATPARMRPEKIFEWIARFNGGHVGLPELQPHTLSGGLKAWRFAGNWWAFPQKDEAGCIFGIKLWQEPL